LAQHAACYNEVKYHSLKAQINGQASSLTVGSVILAFCSDPADNVPDGTDAIVWARSQRCNRSAKYWETIAVSVPQNQMVGPNDGFFKNNVGKSDTPRTYSPGFFSLIVISPANQPTPLEIQLEWDVTLRNPTLNTGVEEGASVSTALEDFGLLFSDNADVPYANNLEAYTSIGSRGLTKNDFSPALRFDVFYLLPGGQLTITGNTGASGAPESVIATHISIHETLGGAVQFYRFDAPNGTFDIITDAHITARPSAYSAPSFRRGSDWVIDPASPGLATASLGFQHLQLRQSTSRQKRSTKSRHE